MKLVQYVSLRPKLFLKTSSFYFLFSFFQERLEVKFQGIVDSVRCECNIPKIILLCMTMHVTALFWLFLGCLNFVVSRSQKCYYLIGVTFFLQK